MELKVYHDTVNDFIVIETGIPEESIFKLFDGIGQLIIHKEVMDKERICSKGLEDGNYHYKLVAGSRLQVGKLKLMR